MQEEVENRTVNLAVMDGSKCILQLRGVRPFLSDKYDLTQHPNYYQTADADKKNLFDVEKYLHRRINNYGIFQLSQLMYLY